MCRVRTSIVASITALKIDISIIIVQGDLNCCTNKIFFFPVGLHNNRKGTHKKMKKEFDTNEISKGVHFSRSCSIGRIQYQANNSISLLACMKISKIRHYRRRLFFSSVMRVLYKKTSPPPTDLINLTCRGNFVLT